MYRFHFILSVYVSSNHANICQKGLHLQVTVNPEIGGRWNCRMLLRGIYEKGQGKIGEKQKMKKGSGSSALSRSEFLLWVLQAVPKIVHCLNFPPLLLPGNLSSQCTANRPKWKMSCLNLLKLALFLLLNPVAPWNGSPSKWEGEPITISHKSTFSRRGLPS